MKFLIPCMYASYGRYINRFRLMPYYIDLLLPIHRRLLIVLAKTAGTKFVKTARVIGDLIGKYHPHGDLSAYDTLINMSHNDMCITQGNWGIHGLEKKLDYAPYRYTEVQSNLFFSKNFMELIKYVKKEFLEYHENEPLYLAFPLPIGLIGKGILSGTTFYSTKIPRYTKEDLFNRLNWLLMKQQYPNDENILNSEPIIIPNIINCNLYEINNSFQTILTTGNGIVYACPKTKLFKDHIEIYGKEPTSGFSRLIKNADNLDLLVIDNSKSSHGIHIIVKNKKNKILNETFHNEIRLLISRKIYFNCNVVFDDETVKVNSIDAMLLRNYKYWMKAYTAKKEEQKFILTKQLFYLNVIRIIREILQKNSSVKTISEIIKLYNQKYYQLGIESKHIEIVCNKYTITKLIEWKFDEVNLQNSLLNVNYVLDNIEYVGYNKLQKILK